MPKLRGKLVSPGTEEGIRTKPWRLLAIVGGSLLLGLGAWQAYRFLRPPQDRPALAARLRATTNVLLIGTDARTKRKDGTYEGPRTDVLIIAACDPTRNRVSLLSIPRDTLVDIPGHGRTRINMANVYGGLTSTKLMVEGLTGLKVDRYVAVDFRAFEELIDLLGGVEVVVDKRMYYRDSAQNLQIDLRQGRQVLNGDKALEFVRYRHDPMGDITRVERQQRLLRAILDKAVKEHLWTKIVPLYRLKKNYIRTNLSLLDLYRLRNFTRDLARQSNLSTFTVPGWFSGPYWEADANQLAALLEKEFKPAATPVPGKKKEDK